jgi:L-asparaginase
VITTGGTIAYRHGKDFLRGGDLVAELQDLPAGFQVELEEVAEIGSSEMTLGHWASLAHSIHKGFENDPDLAGIVVTHGTDTLEETAFFLDLVNRDPRPIVLTGAMLNADAPQADGPRNLAQAIMVAGNLEARQRGVLVVLNGAIHRARDARKTFVGALDAFQSVGIGPEGELRAESVLFHRAAKESPLSVEISPDQVVAAPRVDIIWSYLGGDGALLRAALGAGAKGAVIAGFGSGRLTPDLRAAVLNAAEAEIPIALASRVSVGELFANKTWPPALMSSGVLDPVKARVLLMLGIATQQRGASLQLLFDRFR